MAVADIDQITHYPDMFADMVCEICHSGDREHELLLCDCCEKGYHLSCLDPPLPRVPEGDWVCSRCDAPVDALSGEDEDVEELAGSPLRVSQFSFQMPLRERLQERRRQTQTQQGNRPVRLAAVRATSTLASISAMESQRAERHFRAQLREVMQDNRNNSSNNNNNNNRNNNNSLRATSRREAGVRSRRQGRPGRRVEHHSSDNDSFVVEDGELDYVMSSEEEYESSESSEEPSHSESESESESEISSSESELDALNQSLGQRLAQKRQVKPQRGPRKRAPPTKRPRNGSSSSLAATPSQWPVARTARPSVSREVTTERHTGRAPLRLPANTGGRSSLALVQERRRQDSYRGVFNRALGVIRQHRATEGERVVHVVPETPERPSTGRGSKATTNTTSTHTNTVAASSAEEATASTVGDEGGSSDFSGSDLSDMNKAFTRSAASNVSSHARHRTMPKRLRV